MKIIVAGADGYLGFPLSLHLLERGHTVIGVDNFSRRSRVREVGAWSATEIASPWDRYHVVKQCWPNYHFRTLDLQNYDAVNYVFEKWKPDACVHLGEIPSAPYSMIDRSHCNETMINNIVGTNNILWALREQVPDCHLVKLGTMGEYGTPNVDIPEGFFEVEFRGRKDKMPFPRQAGSWYHQSKVHDTHNVMFACKIWGLRSTDIMQGVVYGVLTPEIEGDDNLVTRFDFDEVWGTAINRFCAQAVIGHDLTPYGKGGQTRGYIALRDSMQCLRLALENPADEGEYRVFNQFDECYSVNELSHQVALAAQHMGLNTAVWNLPNPRIESEEHYYNPDHTNLYNLGFKPTRSLHEELKEILLVLMRCKKRIEAKRDKINPTVTWA